MTFWGGVCGMCANLYYECRYETESMEYILEKVIEWERENGDEDDTEEEGEGDEDELGISGVQRSERVPVGMH